MTGKQIGGLILLVIGGSVLLGMLGIHVGGLISLVLGVLLIVYGIKKWKENSHFWAGIVLILGTLFIIGSIPIVMSLLIGGLLVYWGWRFIQSNDGYHVGQKPTPSHSVAGSTMTKPISDPFDEEWERLMK